MHRKDQNLKQQTYSIKQQMSKSIKSENVHSRTVYFSFPFPFSIFLSEAQTELARFVPLPLSGLGSDKAVLSTWPSQCYVENLVYGPSTLRVHSNRPRQQRDSAGLQPSLCWYQESYRHSVTAKAEAPCLSHAGGKRGSVYFSLLLCYWKISTTWYWWCVDYGKKETEI